MVFVYLDKLKKSIHLCHILRVTNQTPLLLQGPAESLPLCGAQNGSAGPWIAKLGTCRSVKACLSKVDCFWRFKTEVQKPVHVGDETCDNPRGLVPKEGQTEANGSFGSQISTSKRHLHCHFEDPSDHLPIGVILKIGASVSEPAGPQGLPSTSEVKVR